MTIEDDVRTMLHRRASDVRVSDEGWDAIAARLDEPVGSSRRWPALAGAAVAAALVAGVIVVSQNDEPSPPVADTTTTSVVPAGELPPHVWEGEPWQDAGSVAETYLKVRTGVQVTTADYEFSDNDRAVARFVDGGVATELWLQKVGDRWMVLAAASDLVPIHEPKQTEGVLTGTVTVEATGVLQVGSGGPFADWGQPRQVQARDSVPIRHEGEGTIRALLRTSDGTIALSEVMPIEGPTDVARRFLDDELGLRDASVGLQDFQQGDARSGEIPYVIVGGESGTILLRQNAADVWSVTAITSDALAVHVERVQEGYEVTVGEIDADDVHVTVGDVETTMRPGQRTTITAARPESVRAIARKDGLVVAVFVNPLAD